MFPLLYPVTRCVPVLGKHGSGRYFWGLYHKYYIRSILEPLILFEAGYDKTGSPPVVRLPLLLIFPQCKICVNYLVPLFSSVSDLVPRKSLSSDIKQICVFTYREQKYTLLPDQT